MHLFIKYVTISEWLYGYTSSDCQANSHIHTPTLHTQLQLNSMVCTLYTRGKIEDPHCRFRCKAVEDPHHLFINCTCYSKWRREALEEVEKCTSKKLDEKGTEEMAQKRLLRTAKSLFISDKEVWPLQQSFHYLGHLLRLDELLLLQSHISLLTHEHLLHHLTADWHTHSIQLAGRIFGDD